MKWHAPFLWIPVVIVVIFLVGGCAYLSLGRQPTDQVRDTVVPSLVPTASSQSITPNRTIQRPEHLVTESPVVVPDTTSISPASTQSITGWKVYTNEEYKFEIQYPPKDWLLTSKIQSPFLSYNPLEEPVFLYTQRFIPAMESGQSAPITIAVYDKSSKSSMVQWLSEGYGMDFAGVQEGDLETALARAYESAENAVVSYREYGKGDTNVFEVGAVLDNGLIFIYATFFTKENPPYVYEISFDLAYYGPEWEAEPSDSDYIELYKQIVATFKFTD